MALHNRHQGYSGDHHPGQAVNNLFLNNFLQRTIFAKSKFHNLMQGDLSITAFSSKLKCIADTLHDISSPISNHDMMLALTNGLSN